MNDWVVYIVSCRDGSLYTGVSNDLPARLEKHRSGKGAKYLRGKAPIVLKYVEQGLDKSCALKREYRIKKLKRQDKLRLIEEYERHTPL